MVVEVHEVLKRIKAQSPEHASGAQAVAELVASLQREGRLPERLPLEDEWKKQAGALASLFAKELDMKEEDYINSLPKLTLPPENRRDGLGGFVMVETRIKPRRQCQLADIHYFIYEPPLGEISDWSDGSEGDRTPNTPYLTWYKDIGGILNKDVLQVRASLKPEERGGTVFDGIALFIAGSPVLKNYDLFLPGTQYFAGPPRSKEEHAVHQGLDREGHKVIEASAIGSALPNFGHLVCLRN